MKNGRDTFESVSILTACLLSIVSCLVIVTSMFFDNRTKKAYHLQLVRHLLSANLLLSLLYGSYWFYATAFKDDEIEKDFCNAFMFGNTFAVLACFEFQVLIAVKFRRTVSNSLETRDMKLQHIPLIYYWLFGKIFYKCSHKFIILSLFILYNL